MTIRLFSSTDSGAPQLSDSNDGSLLTILRACLVDGYGSRTPQGWTMPFSDLPNNKAAFKTVAGKYFRLDDNLEYRWAQARGYSDMTDVDTGTGAFPNSNNLTAGNEWRIAKKAAAGTAYQKWFVISDDEWFYYYAKHDSISPASPTLVFFGQYECVEPSFTYNYAITGQEFAPANTTVPNLASIFSATDFYCEKHYQNLNMPVLIYQQFNAIGWSQPNPFSGKNFFEKPLLRDTFSPYVHYGYFPHFLRLTGNENYSYRGGEKITIGGLNYILAAHTGSVIAIEYETDAN